MKYLNTLILLLLISLTACTTAKQDLKSKLTQKEIQELCSKKSITLSDSLRQRLLADKEQLKLTPTELQVLRKTGKVILCGDCGYILNSLKMKEHNKKKAKEENLHMPKKLQPDSLRKRVILTYDNWGTYQGK
jgi:hypothetical protein